MGGDLRSTAMIDVLAERYELRGRLGAGGMAEVYDGWDPVLDRRVAVKVLRRGLDGHAQERFLREARTAASLSHPNIVAVYDTGRHGELAYLVMEHVDGPDLARVLRDGPLPQRRATRITDQLLAALAAAHARGLVHRDVKPANVLLTGDGTAKLTDFGIAKRALAGSELTATGQVFGTPAYLSPEQARGEPAGPGSDLYAVGCVLYEMIAGRPPFVGDDPMAVIHGHLREPPPPLFRQRPGVDMSLVRVTERALAKHPSERFGDAEQMRDALAANIRAAPAAPPTRRLPPRGGPPALPSAPPSGRRPPGRRAPAAAPRGAPRGGSPRRPVPPRAPRARARPPARQGTEPWVLLAGGAVGLIILLWAVQALGTGVLSSLFGSDDGAAEVVEEPADEGGGLLDELPSLPGVGGAELERLSGLLDEVRADPEAFGERGDDLVEGVDETLDADGLQQLQRGAELAEDVQQWSADGELDPGLADQVRSILGDVLPGELGG